MSEILYILTRTSGRPEFFKKCRKSVKALDWPGPVVHIVHTDDPRDTYIEADIIVKGETFGPSFGDGFYNLYNNRLLKAIPSEPGWVHFMDDDDEYIEASSLGWLYACNRDALHVCKTRRLGVSKNHEIFPALWKKQKSFQTECFAVWSTIAKKYQWWGSKGGDHNYTAKITRKNPIIWHDTIATQSQSGKGHGERADASGKPVIKADVFKPLDTVHFKMFTTIKGRKQAQLLELTYMEAEVMEKHGVGRVTYRGVSTEVKK